MTSDLNDLLVRVRLAGPLSVLFGIIQPRVAPHLPVTGVNLEAGREHLGLLRPQQLPLAILFHRVRCHMLPAQRGALLVHPPHEMVFVLVDEPAFKGGPVMRANPLNDHSIKVH